MASIKRRKDSPYWLACFALPDGTRKQVSTQTTDEHEARKRAIDFERATVLARQRKLTDSIARRVMRDITASAGLSIAMTELTLADFLRDQLAKMPVAYRNPRTRERYAHALTNLRDNHPAASLPIAGFGRRDAMAWRDKLVADGLAPASVNHQLSTIRRAFADGVESGVIEENPWHSIRDKRHGLRQKREPFTFGQFAALLNALSLADCPVEHADEWLLLVLVAGYTGQRKSDCVALHADAINFDRGTLGFYRSKNADRHEVPLHPALAARLAPLRGKTGPLFPNLAKLPPRGRNSISDQFRNEVLPLIGVVQPYSDGGTRHRQIPKHSFHSLRHSLSSWLNEAGVSDVDRMALVGHDDSAVSRGYTHAGLENAKRAIALLPAPTPPRAGSGIGQSTPPSPRP